eukprot:scaffold1885_cov402-Prasinococcus_capsulatus_cf.AAC.8
MLAKDTSTGISTGSTNSWPFATTVAQGPPSWCAWFRWDELHCEAENKLRWIPVVGMLLA